MNKSQIFKLAHDIAGIRTEEGRSEYNSMFRFYKGDRSYRSKFTYALKALYRRAKKDMTYDRVDSNAATRKQYEYILRLGGLTPLSYSQFAAKHTKKEASLIINDVKNGFINLR